MLTICLVVVLSVSKDFVAANKNFDDDNNYDDSNKNDHNNNNNMTGHHDT